MSFVNYDPNSNRASYLRAFEEFQGRRSDALGLNKERSNINNGITDTHHQHQHQTVLNNSVNSSISDTYDELVDMEQYLKAKALRSAQPQPKTAKLTFNNSKNTPSPHKNMSKSKKNKSTSAPNNSVIIENEVKEFEKNHCNNTNVQGSDEISSTNVRSPPSRFFKSNTNPFPSPTLPKRTNERNQIVKPQNNILRSTGESTIAYSMASTKVEGGMKKTVQRRSAELDTHSTSSNDEGSSSGICSGGSSSDPLDRPNLQINLLDKQNHIEEGRRIFRYEKEINKYGDVVEYAMPQTMSLRNDDDLVVGKLGDRDSRLNDVKPDQTEVDDFVDNNFDFLNDCQTSYVLSSHLPKDEELLKPGAVKITDLDESTDVNLTGNSNSMGNSFVFYDYSVRLII